MLIDTHCHLSEEDYDNLDEIIKNMDGIMIASGCDDKTNKEVLDLIKKYDNVYGTLGIHPEEIDIISDDSFKLIEDNLNNPKIVAIGEIGLDYYWTKETKENKKKYLNIEDTYNILKKYKLRGSIHCFSSTLEMAKKFIKLGYKIGVGGTITFKNSKQLQDVIKQIDISDLLLETDSPYLTPEPYRGKRNNPQYVYLVALKLSELKNIDIKEVLNVTNKNAISEFDLKKKK